MNTFKITNILKLFTFLKEPDLTMPLGRWCHINMPKCNTDVIDKKINFANLDNNICNFNKKYSKVRLKLYIINLTLFLRL